MLILTDEHVVLPGQHKEEASVRGIHIHQSNAGWGIVRRKNYVDSAGSEHSALDGVVGVLQVTKFIGEGSATDEH